MPLKTFQQMRRLRIIISLASAQHYFKNPVFVTSTAVVNSLYHLGGTTIHGITVMSPRLPPFGGILIQLQLAV